LDGKENASIIILVVLHAFFLILTYDANLLLALGSLNRAIILERTFMLLQFLPLIFVLTCQRLSRKKALLFLSFALCVSTVYAVDDFHTGFYAAILNHDSGIMPRMRTSAHLLAYKDMGHLVILDTHAEYFFEFVLVHFLSEILGLNYIIIYSIIIRLVSIVLWSSLFVWAFNSIKNNHKPIWSLMLAGSVLIAMQGYNYEVSFAPLLLFMWFLLVTKKHFTTQYVTCSMIITIGILLASFRETVLLSLLSMTTVLLIPLFRRLDLQIPELENPKPSYVAVCLMLGLARIFQLSSISYAQTYTRWFFSLLDSIATIFRGETLFKSQPLSTVWRIGNSIDQIISLGSVICALSFMALLALLCLTHILYKRNSNSFLSSILVVYVVALALPTFDYLALIMTGSSTMIEHSTFTVLARSLLPLVTVTMASNFIYRKNQMSQFKNRFKWSKWLKFLAITGLSVCIMFAPFWSLIGEVKTSYDMIRTNVDNNAKLITGTYAYYFVTDRLSISQKVVFSPLRARSFFSIYYSLLFRYVLGENRVLNIQIPTSTESAKIYDNGIYIVKFYHFYLSDSLMIDQIE
jgi:hypothetical protein